MILSRHRECACSHECELSIDCNVDMQSIMCTILSSANSIVPTCNLTCSVLYRHVLETTEIAN